MRASTRTLVAAAVVGGALTVTSPALAVDLDCSDFATSAEATAAMGPGDPNGLDADDDGIACETSLPPGNPIPEESDDEQADDEQADDDGSTAPTGGVDAGMGGMAGDDPFMPIGLTLLGGGLAVGGAVAMRRRQAQ